MLNFELIVKFQNYMASIIEIFYREDRGYS